MDGLSRPSSQSLPGNRIPSGWRRDLLALGVIGGAGLAIAGTLANGAPDLVSVLATGGAAAGLLGLAHVSRPSPRPARVAPSIADVNGRSSHGDVVSTGAPSVRLRTSTWPTGRSIRPRGDHADSTYLDLPRPPVGDAIWSGWEPANGELPSHLVGPVPETFVPLGPTPSSDLFDTGVPTFVLPALRPQVSAPPTTISSLTPRPLDAEDVAFTDIEIEALTPIPPHLRPIETAYLPAAEPPVAPPSEPPLLSRARCSTCRRGVVDTPAWRHCPECHGALCGPCSVAALRTQARAWCTLCAPLFANP